MPLVAHILILLTAIGVGTGLLQLLLVEHYFRQPDPPFDPGRAIPLSILKPLCGVDDGLRENLASFLDLDYPEYELLLGAESAQDPAWALAQELERQYPEKVRAVLRQGSPGFNPKVNQLLTLLRHARFEHLVISDSNVRVQRHYLQTIAALLVDPTVGLVTHPVVGIGARRLGALLDNLHTTASILPCVISAKQPLKKDYVVGKSMALSRTVLGALGGFEAYQDAFAEDHLIGRHIPAQLGKRVALSRTPVFHVTQEAGVGVFWARFVRWSIMQRTCAGYFNYAFAIMLSPTALALLAALLWPSEETAWALLLTVLARMAIEGWLCLRAPGARFPWWTPLAVPLQEVLMALAWTQGLLRNHIEWRGKRFGVRNGSTLVTPARAVESAP